MRRLRVMIVDDEPLAREHIADRLAHEENVEIVGTADNGDDALEAIRRLEPDLVFLDVQMPGMNGIEVAEGLLPMGLPATIFTTAYDKYALKAFDVAAVDYLVKPFDDERFSEAFRRARRTIEMKDVERGKKWLQRIPVEMRGQMRVVPVERIDYITASGPYAELHVGERTFAVRERMQDLEEKLDPDVFMRVHRSAIVRLKDGTELSVSRARREALEERLAG